MEDTVLVSVPYYRCQDRIRKAVESILGQTYRDLVCVVMNDGDPSSHDELKGIKDDRLLIYDLPTNRGRYFADQVAVQANPYPFFAPHDADDWSEDWRLRRMMEMLILKPEGRPGFDAVFTAQYVYKLTGERYVEDYSDRASEEFTPSIRHIAHHAALYRTDKLRMAGGYHPDFRVGYDTLLANLVKMRGRIFYDTTPSYHRVSRADSLTKAKETRWGSDTRAEAFEHIKRLYKVCRANPDRIDGIVRDDTKERTRQDVSAYALDLRAKLEKR